MQGIRSLWRARARTVFLTLFVSAFVGMALLGCGVVTASGNVVSETYDVDSFDEIEIHTTDLTELDVGSVVEGQPAKVAVDALPESEFAGTVQEIALQGQDYRGDIVYKVTIVLDDQAQAEALRWGMTAMVEIVVR